LRAAKQKTAPSLVVRASTRSWCDISFSALALLVVPSVGYAQSTLYWDINGNTAGLGGTGAWNTANTFWNTSATGAGGTVSTWNNGAVNNAIFGGTAGTVTLGTPITAGNLTFATTGYTLTGSTLTLGGPTPIITTNAGISTTISSILSGTNGLTKAGTGTLTLSGVNTFTGGLTISAGTLQTASSAGAGTGTVTLGDAATGSNNVAWRIAGSSSPLNNIIVSSSGTGTVTLGGYSGGIFTIYQGNVQLGRDIIVQDDTGDRTSFTGVISGAGNITISGSRVSFDNNANTATGVITINPGAVLQLNANTGVRSNASIVNNGALRLVPSNGAVAPAPVIQGLNGGGPINAVTGGAVNLSVGFNDASGSYSGVISNGAAVVSLTKIGAGTQVLSGANVYTGTTTVSGGTLQVGSGGTTGTLGIGAISNNASLVFNRSNTLTVANAISGAGSLTQAGTGTTILTSANSYTGAIAINQGTLQAGSTSAFGNNSAVTLADVAGATLNLNGFNSSIGSLAGGGPAGGNVSLGAGTLTTGGNNTSTIYGGTIGGTGAFIKTGTGTLALTGANTYTGTTTVNAGTLQVGNGGTFGSLGTGAISNNASLVFNRSDTLTVANAISGTGSLTQAGAGTTILTNANSYTGATAVSGGTLQVGNGGTTGTLGTGAISNNASLVFNRSNTLTVASAISGTGSLTQAGGGTTVLSGANSYTGTTAINQGTLQAGSTSAFGNNSAVTLADVAGATLDLNGFNNSIGSLAGGGTAGGNVSLGTATLTTGGNNTSTSYGGAISGTGAFVKTGTGTQTLTGNSTFTGTTSVEAGTLSVNGSLCGTMNVQSGARLQGTGTVCNTTNFAGGTIAPGNSIGTLKVNGNYAGNGGVLEMETILSGAGSPADRLLITGNATGTTQIRSINLGGNGAVTGLGNTDGISIIQVGGASTASTFQLQGGYAASGPYQYRLNFFAPGASAAAQADPLLGTAVFGDYRLQSAVDATGAPIPVPQVPAYQSMPSGALRYGASMLNGLHQRLGDIRRLSWTGKEESLPRGEFFLRGNASSTEFSGDRGPDFDQDMQFVQAGGNFVKWNIGEAGSTLRLGGALSYGNSDLTVKGSSARVDLKGTTLALMTTWRGAGGEYLDVVGQGTRYRSEVRTLERGNVGAPKGWGWGLSVEGGYPLKMANGLIVEPQAQLSYQRVSFDRFTDVDNITVDLENSASLRGRAGVRLQNAADEGQQWLPFMEVNLLHEFLKGRTINASGVGFRSDLGGTSLQLAAGVNAQLSRNVSFFLTLGFEKGVSKASADTLSGNVGLRMSF
jgi:fibronectin-binding autotransporter adhesin